jgi:hypothetical protein
VFAPDVAASIVDAMMQVDYFADDHLSFFF